MATVSDTEMALARVYSTSMLELAQAQGQEESLGEELADLAAYLDEAPDFSAYLASPMVDDDDRSRTLEHVFRGRASHLLVDSLQVLNRKGRLSILRSVAQAYQVELEELKGRVFVQVRTAVPLTEEQRRQLAAALQRYTGKEVDLQELVDSGLLGGLVVRIGDEKIDASVSMRLRKLAEALSARASYEIRTRQSYVEDAPAS